MSDRDALAREIRHIWRGGDVRGPSAFPEDWKRLADHVSRLIEAAVTAERERCAMICRAWFDAFGAQEIEFVSAKTWATDSVADIEDAIRAGLPAPAAPVVWTDAQVNAALCVWYGWKRVREASHMHLRVSAMRAALEAASKAE